MISCLVAEVPCMRACDVSGSGGVMSQQLGWAYDIGNFVVKNFRGPMVATMAIGVLSSTSRFHAMEPELVVPVGGSQSWWCI